MITDPSWLIDDLKKQIRQLEKRVRTLERDSHPPIDLEPAIRAILTRFAQEEKLLNGDN